MLTWSVEGHVNLRFRKIQGGNAVVSGIFFDPETNQPPNVRLTSPGDGARSDAPQILTLGAEATDRDGVRKVQFFADGVRVGETTNAPFIYPWSAWSGSYPIFARAVDGKGAVSSSAAVQVQIGLTNAHAEFVGMDTNTQGNWRGVYGKEGHLIVDDETNFVDGIQLKVSEMVPFVWTPSVFDPRAPECATRFGRTASALVIPANGEIELILRDGRYHQLSVYCLDWDSNQRVQKFSLRDAESDELLDERTVSDFHEGLHVSWNVRGHVALSVTSTGGANGLISGVFLDPVVASFDAWRLRQFSIPNLQDLNVSGDFGDPDLDGLLNLLEYQRGSSPLVPEIGRDLEARVEGEHLVVVCQRSPGTRYLRVALEGSSDLVAWSSDDGLFDLVGSETVGEVEKITYRSAGTIFSRALRFVRLRVERY